MAVAWTVAPAVLICPLRVIGLQPCWASPLPVGTSPARRRSGSCSRCRPDGWRRTAAPTCWRSRRSALSPPATRREAHGRDDADGLAAEPAPARDVAREAVAQARLAGRPAPGERGLAPRITRRRGDVRAAGRADLRAADRFEGSGLSGSSCTVSTRPSRLKRTPRSTSVATTFLPGGAAGRSTSDSRATVTTTATRATTTTPTAAAAASGTESRRRGLTMRRSAGARLSSRSSAASNCRSRRMKKSSLMRVVPFAGGRRPGRG